LTNIDKLAGAHVDIVEYSPEEICEGVISGISPDITDEDILSALKLRRSSLFTDFLKLKMGLKLQLTQ